MTIENYIRIDGEYKRQEDISKEQMKEISETLLLRMANAFGYEAVSEEPEAVDT